MAAPRMRHSPGNEVAVSLPVRRSLASDGELNLTLQDHAPLALVGVFRQSYVLFEGHEEDLVGLSLGQIGRDPRERDISQGQFLDGIRKQVSHGIWSLRW